MPDGKTIRATLTGNFRSWQVIVIEHFGFRWNLFVPASLRWIPVPRRLLDPAASWLDNGVMEAACGVEGLSEALTFPVIAGRRADPELKPPATEAGK